jgi:hypothetical protein
MKIKLLGWVFHGGAYHKPGEVIELSVEEYASIDRYGMAERLVVEEPKPEDGDVEGEPIDAPRGRRRR